MTPSDKRRPDLAIPYVHKPDTEDSASSTSVISQTMPMMAMFMRSKLLGWAGLFFSVHALLSQGKLKSVEEGFGLTSVITSLIGVAMSYMDFVYVPTPPAAKA